MKNITKTLGLAAVLIILLIVATIIINKQSTDNGEPSKAKPKAAIEVTESNFEEEAVKSEKKVLIDFYATWCEPCKKLSPVLEEVAGEHDEIKLIKIDVDKNPKLAEKFNIEAMPTLVVLENGEEVTRSVGVISKLKIINLIK